MSSRPSAVYLILTLLFGAYGLLIALSKVLCHRQRFLSSLPFVLIAADAVVVSALLVLQRSTDSVLVSLYALIIVAAMLNGRLPHLVYAAVLCAVLYGGVVLAFAQRSAWSPGVAGSVLLVVALAVAAIRLPWALRARERTWLTSGCSINQCAIFAKAAASWLGNRISPLEPVVT